MIKNKRFLKDGAPQFKANLHSHSTESDGLLSQQEMIALYKSHGYSVLAFTEHETYTNTTKFDTDDFIILPGIERSIMLDNNETFHINGIGNPSSNNLMAHGEYIEVPKYTSIDDVQKIITDLKKSDNFVVINHMYWSFNSIKNILCLGDFDALEVCNHGCVSSDDSGNNEIYWDQIMWDGKIVKAIAADDNHNSHRYTDTVSMRDCFGGWINVVADKLSRETIYDGIINGNYYSSSGPQIFNYGFENGKLFVECSPCRKIIFKCYPRRGYTISDGDDLISKATYTLRGQEQNVRIICIDENGKKAWTNFFEIIEW